MYRAVQFAMQLSPLLRVGVYLGTLFTQVRVYLNVDLARASGVARRSSPSSFIGSDLIVVAGGSLLEYIVYLNTNALER